LNAILQKCLGLMLKCFITKIGRKLGQKLLTKGSGRLL